MSTAAPSRIMFRHTRFFARQSAKRHASTTEAAKDAAAKSKDTASNAVSNASKGLSRVTSSAGPAVSGAAQRVSKVIGNIGGRTGRMISFVQCKPKPLVHSQGFSADQLRHSELCRRQNGRITLWIIAQFYSCRKLKALKLPKVPLTYTSGKC